MSHHLYDNGCALMLPDKELKIMTSHFHDNGRAPMLDKVPEIVPSYFHDNDRALILTGHQSGPLSQILPTRMVLGSNEVPVTWMQSGLAGLSRSSTGMKTGSPSALSARHPS